MCVLGPPFQMFLVRSISHDFHICGDCKIIQHLEYYFFIFVTPNHSFIQFGYAFLYAFQFNPNIKFLMMTYYLSYNSHRRHYLITQTILIVSRMRLYSKRPARVPYSTVIIIDYLKFY